MTLRKLSLPLAIASVFAAACSDGFHSKDLGLRWKPPRGVSFERKLAGSPQVAQFSGGVRLVGLPAGRTSIAESDLPALQEEARQLVGEKSQLLKTSLGTIPAGPVARMEFRRGDDHVLAYYLAAKGRAWLLTLERSEATYPRAESAFELSLASLRAEGPR